MENKPDVWKNNKIVPWQDARVPVLSHALSRGSAIFEVFGTHPTASGTMIFRMDDHLKRLTRTASFFGMEFKFTMDEIAQGVSRLISHNHVGRGIVKIMAYWGEEAVRDLVLSSKLDVCIFILPLFEEPAPDKVKPVTACFSKWCKLHPETVPVEAKACANYLNSYLVQKDANDRGYDLGINVGTNGFVAEGPMESLFIVINGILKTPSLGNILKSMTRDTIICIAKDNGIPVEETVLTKDDVYGADEIFTCNSVIKITPVARFEKMNLAAPGRVTRQLSNLMKNVMSFKDSRYHKWFQKC